MKEVGVIAESERLALLQNMPEWVQYKGNDKDYYVGKRDKRYMWLRIPPGGYVHKHTDKAGIRRHYVLQTNPDAILFIEGEAYHLKQGGIYDMDGRLQHWAVNKGTEDRIHFIDLQPDRTCEISTDGTAVHKETIDV